MVVASTAQVAAEARGDEATMVGAVAMGLGAVVGAVAGALEAGEKAEMAEDREQRPTRLFRGNKRGKPDTHIDGNQTWASLDGMHCHWSNTI